MDRGSDALKAHVSNTSEMNIRQTRRGWLQELFGCEAKSEFRYFKGIEEPTEEFAYSLEDSECICRLFCSPCHPYTMQITELNTNAELLFLDRPMTCPVGGCKCCCYQEMTVKSGGEVIGTIKEDYYYFVPQFHTFDSDGSPVYKIHPPTCCGGVCFNCCTEGNPCGKGCCKVPFHIFPASQAQTDDGAPFIGKIVKKPKSLLTEVFTDANAFDVTFPEDATTSQKGVLMGAAVFFNTNFFEEDSN